MTMIPYLSHKYIESIFKNVIDDYNENQQYKLDNTNSSYLKSS